MAIRETEAMRIGVTVDAIIGLEMIKRLEPEQVAEQVSKKLCSEITKVIQGKK